jgi:hypothetical protein
MRPDEKDKRAEDEKTRGGELEKKPYVRPELRRFGMAEELTGADAAPSGLGFDD